MDERKSLRIKGADGKPVEIKPGEYYMSAKARPRRLMSISLPANARRVYACLDLATMGFRQEEAVIQERDKKRRNLTPADIARLTGLSDQNVRIGFAQLEHAGLAKREADDGNKLRKGHVRILAWAIPRPAETGKTLGARAYFPDWFPDSWEPFRPLIHRFKMKLIADEAVARNYFEEGERIARDYQKAEEVVARFLERVCARPALNKEERKGKKVLKERAGPPLVLNDSDTVEPPPARAEEEVHALSIESSRYARFKEAYPRQRFDEANAKLIFEGLKPSEQDTVLARLSLFLDCERWQQTPQYIPLASNWLKREEYASDPPPLLDIAAVSSSAPVLSRKDLEARSRVQRIADQLDLETAKQKK
jgi:hypothetical protein